MRKLISTFWIIVVVITMINWGCSHECPDPVEPEPNDSTSCDTTNVTYIGTVVPILTTYCYGCHSGTQAQGNLDLTDYDQLFVVAQNGSLTGSIKHESGYSVMPPDSPKLSDCNIMLIEKWVNDTTFTTDPDPHPCDPDTVYFERDLLPLLSSVCAQPGCHDVTAADNIRLDSYDAVIASDIIKLDKPDESELYEVMIDSDPGNRMPPPPYDAISSDQAQLVLKWIEQDAQNLYCDEMCDTTDITYSVTIWEEIIQKHCLGCHNEQSAGGGIYLENYEDVKAAAEIPAGQYGSLLGVITYDPSNSPMPVNQDKLSDCMITQITKWIENGTPNN